MLWSRLACFAFSGYPVRPMYTVASSLPQLKPPVVEGGWKQRSDDGGWDGLNGFSQTSLDHPSREGDSTHLLRWRLLLLRWRLLVLRLGRLAPQFLHDCSVEWWCETLVRGADTACTHPSRAPPG
jgi:hypothetical protein